MQKVSANRDRRFLSAIDFIPNDGTSQKFTVQTDLMSASGQRMEFKQRVTRETLQSLVFRDRFAPAALGDDRHLFTMAGIATNECFHPARWCRRLAIHKRKVDLFHFAQAELIL